MDDENFWKRPQIQFLGGKLVLLTYGAVPVQIHNKAFQYTKKQSSLSINITAVSTQFSVLTFHNCVCYINVEKIVWDRNRTFSHVFVFTVETVYRHGKLKFYGWCWGFRGPPC